MVLMMFWQVKRYTIFCRVWRLLRHDNASDLKDDLPVSLGSAKIIFLPTLTLAYGPDWCLEELQVLVS